MLQVCVKPDGAVDKVKMLHTSDLAFTGTLLGVLGNWRYRPYLVDGRPVPFCTIVRLDWKRAP
jgi:hypothetical protein